MISNNKTVTFSCIVSIAAKMLRKADIFQRKLKLLRQLPLKILNINGVILLLVQCQFHIREPFIGKYLYTFVMRRCFGGDVLTQRRLVPRCFFAETFGNRDVFAPFFGAETFGCQKNLTLESFQCA